MEAPAESLLVEGRESRYHRQALIPWWDQARVGAARVLVIGAGALGNEIGKLLALIGCGATMVVDSDHIERSNLSRAVLFRERDEGRAKAEVVAERMQELNPEIRAAALHGNALTECGLGLFAWADVVIGAVDNREARVFINSACARVRKVWIDGAIEGLSGVVRAFAPWRGACYECTMNRTDRMLLAERRSCALLARAAVARGHVPTTAVAASIIGAMQVQEAIKVLHGQPVLEGAGLHLDGLFAEASRVSYPRREDCSGHDELGELEPLGLGTGDLSLRQLLARAKERLGPEATLDLSRDVISALSCPACGESSRGGVPLGALAEAQAACPACKTHRIVEICSSVSEDCGVDLELTPAQLGLPKFDVLVARAGMERRQAWVFDGDSARVLGPLGDARCGRAPAFAGAIHEETRS